MNNQVKATENRKLINDLVRINVLEEEIAYYRTLLQLSGSGHIHTTINFINARIKNLKGEHPE